MERTKAPPAPTRKPDHTFRNAGGIKIQAWDYTEEDRNPSDVDVKKVDPEQVPDATEDADATQQSERFIYVHSEARQKTEEQILEKKGVEYEQAIMKIHQRLSTPRCLKDYDKVLIKIGRLKQKFTSGSHLYEVSVTGSDTDPKRAQSVTITQLPAHRRRALAVGGYILRTSHTDWTLEEVVRLYWRRTEIESAFRSMKSDLGMRPIYHSKDAHIEAHLFVTVLTYYTWCRLPDSSSKNKESIKAETRSARTSIGFTGSRPDSPKANTAI